MKKIIFSLHLIIFSALLFMVYTQPVYAGDEDFWDDDFYYNAMTDDEGNKTAMVEFYFGDSKIARIPEEVNGYKVYGIRKEAFSENETIEEIYLPDSLTRAETNCFYNCTNLKKIHLGSLQYGLENHGLFWLLQNCDSLEEITMSDQANFSLEYDGFDSFGEHVFYNDMLTHLKRIYIGDSMAKVDAFLFYGDALEYVEIGKNNPTFSSIDGIVYSKDGKELICCGTSYQASDVILPDGVEKITHNAFYGCKNIKSITLPASLTYMKAELNAMPNLETIILKGAVPEGLEADIAKMSDITIEYPSEYASQYMDLIDNNSNVKWEADIPILPDDITLNQSSVTLQKGKQLTLTASLIPAYATEKEIVWTSSNPSVASVDNQGLVIAVDEGTAIITAATTNGKTASCSVDVSIKHIHTWDAGTITTAASCEENGVKTFTCADCGETRTEAIPATGHKPVVDPGLAPTTTSTGLTEGSHCSVCGKILKYQESIPFADSQEEKKESSLQKVSVSGIKLTAVSSKIAAGKSIQITATVLPKDASNKKLRWTSSNTKVATVSQNGKVMIKKGTGGKSVTITAKATDGSGKSAAFKIKVMKGAVKSIKIKGAKNTLKVGKTMKLKTTVKVTKGKPVNKKVKWTSSNTKYATVSSKGVVKALKAGKGKKVKITAMATDGTGKKKVITIKIK